MKYVVKIDSQLAEKWQKACCSCCCEFGV